MHVSHKDYAILVNCLALCSCAMLTCMAFIEGACISNLHQYYLTFHIQLFVCFLFLK